MVGAECDWVPNKPYDSLNLDALRREAATARMIILCNPGNPTGRIYPDSDLQQLEQLLAAYPALLLNSPPPARATSGSRSPRISTASKKGSAGSSPLSGT